MHRTEQAIDGVECVVWEHTYPSGSTLYVADLRDAWDDEDQEQEFVLLAFCRAEQKRLEA